MWCHFKEGLTQDKHSCAGLYGRSAVGDAALPLPLVVLQKRLQQQRPIGFDGVGNRTNRVNLKKNKNKKTPTVK